MPKTEETDSNTAGATAAAPAKEVPTEGNAFVAAKAYARAQLKKEFVKSDFPGTDYRANKMGDGEWSINSYVDVQNESGVTVRKKWGALMKYKGEGSPSDPENWSVDGNIEFF